MTQPSNPLSGRAAAAAAALASTPSGGGVRHADRTHPEGNGAMDTPTRTSLGDNFAGLILAKDFQLVRRLGEGGMGQVYLAEQLSLRRKVAVKLLRAELAQDDISRRRFETEAKAVAQLSHANIVQVYAVGEQDGLLFMALEFVDGWTLKDYLTRKGPPELAIALSIMRQVAAALARAAEVGIIHRDIKPENILLTRKVEVKVTDFGLSRIIGQGGLNLTQTGTSMGTPLYMSPEQVMGVPLDPRTDLYSFGATCYHLLAGQPPFTADSAMAVGIKHVQEEPEPLLKHRPDLSADLAALVHRLLAKKPDDRPQTARDALRDLKKISEQLQGAGGSNPNAHISLGGLSSTKLQAPGVRISAPADTTEPYIVESGMRKVPSRWPVWLPWTLGFTLLIAVLAGAAAGQLLKESPTRPSVPTSATTPTPTATEARPKDPDGDRDGPLGRLRPRPGPLGMRPGPDANEQDLRKRVNETQNLPIGDKDGIREGSRVRSELAWHYLFLEQPPQPLKANLLFEQQARSKTPDYRLFGEMGQAIVLIRGSEPNKGIEQFDKTLERMEKNVFERKVFDDLLAMPDKMLARLILQALNDPRLTKNGPLPERVKKLHDQVRPGGMRPTTKDERKEEKKATRPEK